MRTIWAFALLLTLLRSVLIMTVYNSDSVRDTSLVENLAGILGMLLVGVLGGIIGGLSAVGIGKWLMETWKFSPNCFLPRLIKNAACFIVGGLAGGAYGGGLAGLALGISDVFVAVIFGLFGMVYGAFSGSVMGFAYGLIRGGLGDDPPSGSGLILWVFVALSLSGFSLFTPSWLPSMDNDFLSLSVKTLYISVMILLPACVLKTVRWRRGQKCLP